MPSSSTSQEWKNIELLCHLNYLVDVIKHGRVVMERGKRKIRVVSLLRVYYRDITFDGKEKVVRIVKYQEYRQWMPINRHSIYCWANDGAICVWMDRTSSHRRRPIWRLIDYRQYVGSFFKMLPSPFHLLSLFNHFGVVVVELTTTD